MNTHGFVSRSVLVTAVALACIPVTSALADGATVSYSPRARDYASSIDYVNAKPFPLPQADSPSEPMDDRGLMGEGEGNPGYEPGAPGTGQINPVRVIPVGLLDDTLDLEPEAFGTSQHPFTTSRVDLGSQNEVSKLYPYRAAGKLFFKIGSDSYVCSASLIKNGLVVTAAHCVSEFGKGKYYTGFEFHPAYFNGVSPYQKWTAKRVRVMASYLNGTDPCSQAPVVCTNDIAVISLNPISGKYPGPSTGYLGFGWDGFGFNGSGIANGNKALLSQLGYPVSHDQGKLMQRTDSQGFTDSKYIYLNIYKNLS